MKRSLPIAAILSIAMSCVAQPLPEGGGVNRAGGPDIQPMTRVGAWPVGYMADPQPVRTPPGRGEAVQFVSGTTKAVLRCAGPIAPGCFSWAPLRVDPAALAGQVAAAGRGARITNLQNINLFRDDAGGWHAVVTVGIRTDAHPDHWTVVTHAHPAGPADPGEAPRAWAIDAVLSGSFRDPADGNYDAKFFEDAGRLYLLYVRNFVPRPGLRNEIVLQPMLSPTKPAPGAPLVLLSPGTREGAINSEWWDHQPAKLVEAPWIARFGDKYALIYSAGSYLTPGYKIGVAWSDTLLPGAAGRYRKVLQPDPEGVWGQPGKLEARYLLQSEKPRWPNFTGGRVIAPGVGSAVRGVDGVWRLEFAGFAPGDMPAPGGKVDASHRRPFFVRLRANVPAGRTVASASDAELAGWLAPELR